MDRLVVGLFTVSGTLAALGGALLSYSYASANPDPGLQPLILAAVAALLGGVSLAGGRGTPLGLLAGTLSVALLAQIVAVTALPDFTTQLLYAALLAVIVALESSRPASDGGPASSESCRWVTLMTNLVFDFTGRTVVVTGSARGVGRAIAARFRDAGAAVYLVDVDAEPVDDDGPGDRRDRPGRRRVRHRPGCWRGGAGDRGDRTDRRPGEQRRDPP